MVNVIVALEIGGIDFFFFFLQFTSILLLCPGVLYLDISQT